MTENALPEDLRYTAEHEWIRRTGPETARIGITDYAQQQLGDVVFVQLPEVGVEYAAGDSFGEIESTKSVSDVYAPFALTVTAANPALDAAPETVNGDAYGEGWLVDVEAADEAALDAALAAALDAAGYRAEIGD